ncbi:hypothetical protein LJC24_02140 [Desulfococcaceae bacterium OttesenSCG-928-F15]|nr:hypothetical protein [Desulfococcaceae bacterium OttesenSCG-928-F15]
MNFDDLFRREYDAEHYNCLHFTIEAWQALFGIDLSFMLEAFVREGRKYSLNRAARLKKFRPIQEPVSPCLCLMRGLVADETHIASFLDGRILHITEWQGVQYLPQEVVLNTYRRVQFYEPIDHH